MKKNILFITTDEQHIETISAYGATTHKTPNMDRLIEGGTDYTNAISASPVCLPARCCWMTGMLPHQSGSISNIFGATLSKEFPNLFTELKKQGYRTSLHGKCHFIPVPYPAVSPNYTLEYEHFIDYYKELGMDVLDLQDDKNISLWFYDHYSKMLELQGKLKKYKYTYQIDKAAKCVADFPLEESLHPDIWVGKKAVEHIRRSDDNQPNFVWASFSGPHYPIDTPKSYSDRVDMSKDTGRVFKVGEWDDDTKYHRNGFHGPGTTEGSGYCTDGAQSEYTEEYWERWRKIYFGNVVLIDEQIGEILRAADEKWGNNYVVVFTADHGDMMGNHSLWGKNGSLYQDVLHIPLAIYNASEPLSKTHDETVSSGDVFPTILSYANAPIPDTCTGVELQKLVASGGRDHVLSTKEDSVAVICGRHKLVLNNYAKNDNNVMYRELYDLEIDPHEFNNLYGDKEYNAVQNSLMDILNEYEKKELLLSTVFHDKSKGDYWLNNGNGSGLLHNYKNTR